ncbi:MAG: NAD(P)-dependent oxidoreductase [Candidatus Cyclobacteriaceae bacterium M2_1C_046]
MKIGVIKEGKVPIDKRVPLTPSQARELMDKFPEIEVVVQSSDIRCFSDEEYRSHQIKVVTDVEDCDVLMGVKEVPIDKLIPNKTYFFFSHTIKEQPYNRELLRNVLKNKITLIDYEVLTNKEGVRLVAFGRYAGIVGAYNGIWAYGKRYNLFNIRRAHQCFDLDDLKNEYQKVKLPAIKIALTGGGRVARGAMEVLNGMGIRKVTPAEYLNRYFNEPVYVQLNSRDYHKRREGGNYSRSEFFENPEKYESEFIKYTKATDLMVAGAFWDPRAPVLFERKDILREDFKIRVIADITCDIEGSIPSTKKPTTIDEPIYDFNPSDDRVEPPLKEEGNITVMAVDNLPCELPRDASEDFGRELVDNVLPYLIKKDTEEVIEGATIAKDGNLTQQFAYLTDYVGKL